MDPTPDPDIQRVRDAVETLMEFFDNVQIFASRFQDHSDSEADDGTISVNWGDGNWHARRHQVREWSLREDERAKMHVRKQEDQ